MHHHQLTERFIIYSSITHSSAYTMDIVVVLRIRNECGTLCTLFTCSGVHTWRTSSRVPAVSALPTWRDSLEAQNGHDASVTTSTTIRWDFQLEHVPATYKPTPQRVLYTTYAANSFGAHRHFLCLSLTLLLSPLSEVCESRKWALFFQMTLLANNSTTQHDTRRTFMSGQHGAAFQGRIAHHIIVHTTDNIYK